jgi:hypothetical protein
MEVVKPNGTAARLMLSAPQTGKAVEGYWPFIGKVCDHPQAEISIKYPNRTAFKIADY